MFMRNKKPLDPEKDKAWWHTALHVIQDNSTMVLSRVRESSRVRSCLSACSTKSRACCVRTKLPEDIPVVASLPAETWGIRLYSIHLLNIDCKAKVSTAGSA